MDESARIWLKTMAFVAGTFLVTWAAKEALPVWMQALGVTLLALVAWLDQTVGKGQRLVAEPPVPQEAKGVGS